MNVLPASAEEFLRILRYRHGILLRARIAKNPGVFKEINNRAGNTFFVDHSLVRGTLMKGFELYTALEDPFARAAFMLFLVSEVHPFIDGNGRISRVMMNAELVKAGQTRIIIPTVYRDHYIMALKALSKKEDPMPFIRILQKAQEFSATLQGNIMEMKQQLNRSNAFSDPAEAMLHIVSEA